LGHLSQCFLEVDVTRHITRRVGIGNVAGDDALAFGAQHQGFGVKVHATGQLSKHATPRLS
jgi:hypothetical protein